MCKRKPYRRSPALNLKKIIQENNTRSRLSIAIERFWYSAELHLLHLLYYYQLLTQNYYSGG
ncbi:MAG: hypothetical protein QNJ54_10530 [Prochloraceae cyanobacterium]|nr:hypothetical protein [Prochloraceae cyanobacterium]